ncbi:MAG TPA: M48 family metallopeptidase [Candidatus Binataceae bacterium]|nr:M48 family metallopeptidase [Candidatus Binataceae bacterium]
MSLAFSGGFRELERANRRETALLVAVFIALFCALGFGLDLLVGTLRIGGGAIVGFPLLTLAALIIASFQSLLSYYGGAALVLASAHARELTPDSSRHQVALDIVREMALAARMPLPRAYVIDDPAPNAFATGRDPAHSVICLTQGLIDEMDREELQGVIGHEMAHIRDYDIRTMMMIAVLVGGVAMLADFVFRWSFYGGFGARRERDRNDDGGGEAGLIIALVVFVLAIVAPVFSQLIAMAVSRQREYLADAASVEFTRNPRALLRALEQLARSESPLKNGSRGIAHLFIVNPLHDGGDGEGFFDNLLSTHPPLSHRIDRLRALLHEGAPAPSGPASPGAPAQS